MPTLYTPRELVEYAGYRLVMAGLRALPVARAERLVERLARAVFARGGQRVRFVLGNLRIAFPERSEAERCELGRRSYVQLGWRVLDVARSAKWTTPELLSHIELVGREHLERALAKGKGALALTLHLGSFELAMRAGPAVGFPVTVIGRPFANRLLRRHIGAQRTSTGAEYVEHRNVAPYMLRALKRGRVIVVLNDQYSRRSRGVFVPLFGVRASTSLGPAMIALRSGAPIVPLYTVRSGSDLHRIVFEPELAFPATGDRRKDSELLTAHCNEALERIIRAWPEQWMWSHRRFRHSPDLAGSDPYEA